MASVRRSRRIWRNSFMAMAHMPTPPPEPRIHRLMKSTTNEICGQEKGAGQRPAPVLGQASVVVLDLGRGQLAGGPLPELVDQLPGEEHRETGDDAEHDPLQELAGLLRGTLGELGHLVLHLLAGLL